MWDNTNKWIFLHPKKCAGSSIEIILRKHFVNTKEEPKGSQHWNLDSIIPCLSNPLDNYFIFSVARNPWDRMVSMYYHSIKHSKYTNLFDQYIKMRGLYFGAGQLPLKYHLDNSRVDFIIQFQNLEEGVKRVMNKLNVYNYELPHHNHDTDRPKKSYRDFYNEETKNYIAEKFAWDIEKFGYKF
jgi:hypothetical protein